MTAEYVEIRFAPAGELDMATAPDEFDPRRPGDAAFAVVDLSAVTFVDAFALDKIVELGDVMAERGGAVVVVGASALSPGRSASQGLTRCSDRGGGRGSHVPLTIEPLQCRAILGLLIPPEQTGDRHSPG